MKIVAISDLHGDLPNIPECDLLLIGGDICPLKDHGVHRQACWLDITFKCWLQELPVKKIIACAGNHDFVFEKRYLVPKLPWTYLEDDYCEYEGYKIYGSPWQLYFCGWAFNLYEYDIKHKWDLIPDDTEILITHGPPYGFGDTISSKIRIEGKEVNQIPKHVGSKTLTKRIKQLKNLKLHVFGHIHSGFGQFELGNVLLANVSYLDNHYQPTHSIIQFELPDK